MKLDFSKALYGYVVMALYLIIGIFVLLKYWIFQTTTPDFRMLLFGVVVILYGLYRGYRSYMAYQTPNDEKDEVE
jgi:hypothetical protein